MAHNQLLKVHTPAAKPVQIAQIQGTARPVQCVRKTFTALAALLPKVASIIVSIRVATSLQRQMSDSLYL
eukprot:1710643-Rhodomonas_salina.1